MLQYFQLLNFCSGNEVHTEHIQIGSMNLVCKRWTQIQVKNEYHVIQLIPSILSNKYWKILVAFSSFSEPNRSIIHPNLCEILRGLFIYIECEFLFNVLLKNVQLFGTFPFLETRMYKHEILRLVPKIEWQKMTRKNSNW